MALRKPHQTQDTLGIIFPQAKRLEIKVQLDKRKQESKKERQMDGPTFPLQVSHTGC